MSAFFAYARFLGSNPKLIQEAVGNDATDLVGFKFTVCQTFAGLRISWDYLQKLTATTSFTSVLVLDENLADTEDFRADFVNSLLVSISGNLAFRTSFQLLYDNLPSLTVVELESPAGVPTGDSVLTELENVDTLFTVTLVVNF